MQKKSSTKLYLVTVVLESGKTTEVFVRAATQKTANRRALKRTPNANRVQSTRQA